MLLEEIIRFRETMEFDMTQYHQINGVCNGCLRILEIFINVLQTKLNEKDII